jgi:FkbM family methyltransferase
MQKRIELTKKVFTLTHWALGLNDPYFGSPSKTDEKIMKLISSKFNDLTLIDVGAFKGDMTRFFKVAFPKSHAILIEPNKELEDYLISSFPEDEVFTYAISPQKYISYRLNKKNPGQSGEVSKQVLNNLDLEEIVECKTLTEVINNCDSKVPYIIKIDVEGFELDVLSTISQSTFNQINFLWVEITPDGVIRGSSQDAIRNRIPLEFDMFRVISNGLILIANDSTDHWSYNSNLFQNLFFARKGLLSAQKKSVIRL